MTYADGRYGALDIGTVTCRLLVADVEDGRIIDVDKEYAITDLGVGVDATGRLSEAAIERVLACVDRYLEVLARYDTPEHPVRRLIAMPPQPPAMRPTVPSSRPAWQSAASRWR